MKKLIILATILAISNLAYAGGNDNNHDGNGDYHNHGNGDDHNHDHGGGSGGGNGGSGGQGGLGGSGGAGGSSSSTSTNTNTNTNTNTVSNSNTNSNSQSQTQGQKQGQQQSVSNSGNSSATGGSVTGSGNSTNSNTLSTGASTSEASNNGNGSNNTDITYQNYRNPVNTAYAPSLTSGFDTCLGSISGSVQTQILGLSGGGTKVDKNCVLIKQVHLLKEMGMNAAACIRAHDDADMAKAMDAAGVDCSTYDKPKVVERVVEKTVYVPDPAWQVPVKSAPQCTPAEKVKPKTNIVVPKKPGVVTCKNTQ
jgi:hypothetical protein